MGDVSPFCSFHTQDLSVPNHAPHTITIRKLGWKALEKAQRAKLTDVASIANELGEFMQQAADAAEKKAAAAKAAGAEAAAPTPEARQAAGRDKYDHQALLVAAVAAWTFPGPDGAPLAVTPERIADLSPALKTWLVDEVVAYCDPESEDARKNG